MFCAHASATVVWPPPRSDKRRCGVGWGIADRNGDTQLTRRINDGKQHQNPRQSTDWHPLHRPNKERPQVDRNAPKKGVGWLMNTEQGKACSFTNDSPTARAQWVIVETRPLRGGGQPVIRKMLRHNAIEAWETMLATGGWKRCRPRW